MVSTGSDLQEQVEGLGLPEATVCRCGSRMTREIERAADGLLCILRWTCKSRRCQRLRYDAIHPDEGVVETEWQTI